MERGHLKTIRFRIQRRKVHGTLHRLCSGCHPVCPDTGSSKTTVRHPEEETFSGKINRQIRFYQMKLYIKYLASRVSFFFFFFYYPYSKRNEQTEHALLSKCKIQYCSNLESLEKTMVTILWEEAYTRLLISLLQNWIWRVSYMTSYGYKSCGLIDIQ